MFNKDKSQIENLISEYKTIKDLAVLESEIKENLSKEFKPNEIQFWKNALEILNIDIYKLYINTEHTININKIIINKN